MYVPSDVGESAGSENQFLKKVCDLSFRLQYEPPRRSMGKRKKTLPKMTNCIEQKKTNKTTVSLLRRSSKMCIEKNSTLNCSFSPGFCIRMCAAETWIDLPTRGLVDSEKDFTLLVTERTIAGRIRHAPSG